MISLAARSPVLERILLRTSCKHELKSISNPIRQWTIIRPNTPKPCRAFTTTSPLSKKGGNNKRVKEEVDPQTPLGFADDPFDFSTLEVANAKNLEKLKNDLSKMGTGGRFNPEVLESLTVILDKSGSKLRIKLRDIAQIVPKGGRTVMIIVGEKDHVKPITSAIQGARELNLQPVPDPHNTQQLNVPIPPPTKASRDQAVRAVTKFHEAAQMNVRNARAMMQKRLRAMELARTVRPDDLKKAHKDMEKVVQEAFRGLTEVVDPVKKRILQP